MMMATGVNLPYAPPYIQSVTGSFRPGFSIALAGTVRSKNRQSSPSTTATPGIDLPDDCVQLRPTVPSWISVCFSGGAGFAHLNFPSGGAANLIFLKRIVLEQSARKVVLGLPC
jgi:hypothetical protein